MPNDSSFDGYSLVVLTGLYRSLLRIRTAEEKIAELLERHEVHCPTHLYTGQEAIAAGVCAALAKQDYIFGGHRSHGHFLAKGGEMRAMIAEIYGKATGCASGRGGSMHLVAPELGLLGTVPLVAATIPIAVGTALASNLRKDGRVSVAFFGDGATEEGHFHESMNMAALYRLPVIFVCENNLYASHMHWSQRRARPNIIQSADAHGMRGEKVDGNDVIAVHRAAEAAVRHAREGNGPTLLECCTYRWRGHVGPASDMDVGVKRSDELKIWMTLDPVARLRAGLTAAQFDEAELARIEREVEREVDDAVEFAQSSPYPDPKELFDHLFVAPEPN
jgi:acetoin:2,6-dichlorophenolindophenol oxidoreductase subunit alpha